MEWCIAITSATLADRALTTPLTGGETETCLVSRGRGKSRGLSWVWGGSTVLSCLTLRQGSSHGAMLSPSGHWAVSGDMTWVVVTTGGAPGIDGVGPGMLLSPPVPRIAAQMIRPGLSAGVRMENSTEIKVTNVAFLCSLGIKP